MRLSFLERFADVVDIMDKNVAYESSKKFMDDYSIFAAGDVGSNSAIFGDDFQQ